MAGFFPLEESLYMLKIIKSFIILFSALFYARLSNKHFFWRNTNRFARNCEERIISNLEDTILVPSSNEPWLIFILKVSYFISVDEEWWYQGLLTLSTINQRTASRVSKVNNRIFLTADIFEFFQGINSVYHSQGSLFFLWQPAKSEVLLPHLLSNLSSQCCLLSSSLFQPGRNWDMKS